jgi:hypothetical protein
VWNRRTEYDPDGNVQVRIPAGTSGHGGADARTIEEFLRFVRDGVSTSTSPLAARDSVAAGVAAATSLRNGARPEVVPAVAGTLVDYFSDGQPGTTGNRHRTQGEPWPIRTQDQERS